MSLRYACATIIVLTLLGIWAYNHFELWHYKRFHKDGVLEEFVFFQLDKQKCEFNPLLAQGGGIVKIKI